MPGRQLYIPDLAVDLLDASTSSCACRCFRERVSADQGGGEVTVRLDHDGHLPSFAYIIDGKTSDIKGAQTLVPRSILATEI